MAGRNTERRERGPSRREVERAIRTLKKAVARRPDEIRERLRIARAYRVIGETALSCTWYRDVADRLSARGDALKAIAVSRELLEVAPRDTEALLALAKLYARSARARGDHTAGVAVPLGPARQRIARPLTPIVDPGTVLDAAELLKVVDGEELGATEELRKARDRAPHLEPGPPPAKLSTAADDAAAAAAAKPAPAAKPAAGAAAKPAPAAVAKPAPAAARSSKATPGRGDPPDPGPDASGPRRASQVFQALLREATGVHKVPLAPPVPPTPPEPPLSALGRGSTATPGRPDHSRRAPSPPPAQARAPVGPPPPPPPRERPGGPPPLPARAASLEPEEDWDEKTVTIDAAELAALARGSAPVAEERAARALSRVPLFGKLGKTAFMELARGVVLRAVPGGTYLFEEGEQASSFFLVAEGTLEVLRKVRGQVKALGHFGEGQAVGVFGVFAGARRAAAVRAIGDATVLEVPGRVLGELMRKHPAARRALRDFYTERLLENFFATAPLFDGLDAIARGALIARFTHRELAAGSRLVEPGTMSNAFYLVIRGTIDVTRHAGPGKVDQIAKVIRGQFLGVIAALAGHPTVATATASTAVTVAELSHKAFSEYLADHPTLAELPNQLEAQGMLKLRELFVGDAGIPGLGGT